MIDYPDSLSNFDSGDKSSSLDEVKSKNLPTSEVLDLAPQSNDDLFIYPAVIERGHR